MFNKLLKIFQFKKHPAPNKVFNTAVALSLEWGENWLQPINERLLKIYPFLTRDETEELNEKCKQLQHYALELCAKELEGKLTKDKIEIEIKIQYPNLNQKNIRQVIRQGMYYVRK